MQRRTLLTLAGIVPLALPRLSLAQSNFPERSIRLVIPFAPGGATDIMGRHLAQRLGPILGQQVVIENKSSGGGVPGTLDVARARPDGYTLVMGTSSTHGINPSLVANIGYDPVADFAPITVVATQPMLLACHPSFPARTLPELIEVCRRNPGRYSYGSAGMGSINHLTGELFNKIAGINTVHVPYRGSGQSVNDLVAGVLELLHATSSSTLPMFRDGRLRVPAVFTEKRMRTAPTIPTAIEQGMPSSMVSETFNVLCAPAGTPRPIIETLNRACARVMADETLHGFLDQLAIEPVMDCPPERAADYIRADLAKWRPLIRESGIRLE
jgi:tripartite-type tricarboxylate transporter receptor subunit TctC